MINVLLTDGSEIVINCEFYPERLFDSNLSDSTKWLIFKDKNDKYWVFNAAHVLGFTCED